MCDKKISDNALTYTFVQLSTKNAFIHPYNYLHVKSK